jgi:hypothetical protein
VKLWQVLRDVLLTGTAIFIFIRQALSPAPSDVLLAAALALTAPSVADHARALLSGRGGGESSPSPAPQPAQQQRGLPGASGDPPGG